MAGTAKAEQRNHGSVEIGRSGEVVVRGRVSWEEAGQLRRAAIDAVDLTLAPRPTVVDLRACTALDDAALVALICADHHAVRTGRRLVLRGPSGAVFEAIRSLAASLLPIVEEAPEVDDCRCVVAGVAALGVDQPSGVDQRRSRLARWRDPLRRPSRPPSSETA